MNKCVLNYPEVCSYTELTGEKEVRQLSLVVPRGYVTSLGKLCWESLRGPRSASVGDFVILSVAGQYYPFSKEDFEKYFARG